MSPAWTRGRLEQLADRAEDLARLDAEVARDGLRDLVTALLALATAVVSDHEASA